MPPTAAMLPLLLLLIISFPAASSAQILGLDAFLATQYRRDPAATNDSFPSLPSSLKSALSSSSDHRDHRDLISSLLSLSVYVPVHVVLVGSDFPKTSSSLLSAFLASFPASRFHVISPFSSDSHTLSLSHRPQLHVSHAPPSLAASLAESISSSLSQSSSNFRSSLASIPHSPVDELIRSHFESSTKSDPTPSAVYLYFLDLGPQPRPYAYNYAPGNPDPFSPAVTKCLGTIWTGHDRYAWIDLRAGPVDYGPAVSGDGVLPRGDFHPLATLHGKTRSAKGMMADVASITWSAYQVLVTPSLRVPVPFENSLIVQFVHVLSGDGKSGGFDWRNVENSFMDEVNINGLLLRSQSLKFTYYTVKYSECAICSYAIARATNSYTSRFLFDNYTLIVSEYLDSKRLHQVILDSTDEFRRSAGIPEDGDFTRLLPVYIFDLDTTGVFLLDRYHQAVSFKDMVVAVRTKNTQTVSEYSCNGRHVFLQTRELERPLVGSILQSMWGVSPTHLLWSPIHNSTHVDYTWSVGNTPFGPFSEFSSLTFVQKDAARRNLLLTTLNYSIASAIDVLESVISHGGDKYLLRHNQNKEFTQRWNLFKHKLDKAISSLLRYDFEMAFYYMRSSDHDLYEMHDIVYRASQELEASLVCFREPPFPWFPITMSLTAVGSLLYIWSKRDRLFRNKRKQF